MGINVANFISTSGMYGAERWVLAVMSNLDKKKVNSTLITTNTDNTAILREADKTGLKTKLLNVKGNYHIFDFIFKLYKFIKHEKIDILHTHGYKADLVGYFAARLAGIKMVSTPHGWNPNAGLKLRLYDRLDSFFLRFADLVVPLSPGLKDSLKHINKNKIKLIANFVELDQLPKPEKGDLKLITYMGRLVEVKRVQDLITALKYLPSDVKLHVLGDGFNKKRLVKLVRRLDLGKRVKFYGFRKDRLDLLNKSGILVHPSLSEGIPRALMEAMAMERIVVGTNIPGIIDLIKHKKTGLLVPTKDPEKIAEAVKWVLENKKESYKIAKNGRVLIEKEFCASRIAKKYEKIYNDVTR